jgi:glycosyltransferase involved in cell wall biosynthesis
MKTMGNEKGVRKIAQAFIDLKQSVQDAHLLVVGLSENEKEELEEELRPSGIPDSAYTLTTYVPSQNVPQYMCACNALIINYPPEPHFQYYMSPLKLFEYMASGVPIIATDLPAIREVVNEEHVWFVSDYDSQSLSETMEAVYVNRTEAERRASNARGLVKFFTWQQRALSLITLMKGYSRK